MYHVNGGAFISHETDSPLTSRGCVNRARARAHLARRARLGPGAYHD